MTVLKPAPDNPGAHLPLPVEIIDRICTLAGTPRTTLVSAAGAEHKPQVLPHMGDVSEIQVHLPLGEQAARARHDRVRT